MVALALGCCLLTSCTGPEEDDAPGETPGIQEETVRGPLAVRVRTDRAEMTIADRLYFTIAAEAPEHYDIQLPRFGENLEPFLIRDASARQSSLLDDGRVRVSRRYVLEPVVSGEYVIPPMTVSFTDQQASENNALHRLDSPEIAVKVTSLLPKDVSELEVADIVPPREMARKPLRPWWWGALGVIVIAGVAWLLVRMVGGRGETQAAPPPPAHETAYASLKDLVEEDLVAQGRIKEFYQRISGILRVYIERRFDWHAPEQTTEEFLTHLGTSDELPAKQKALLREFLTHCDLVKFAELQPEKEDIQRTFDSCKAFIEETREDRATETKTGGDS